MLDKKLTDNEIVREVERQAPFVCCPMCDEEKCVGKNNCVDIKNYIKRKTEGCKEYER